MNVFCFKSHTHDYVLSQATYCSSHVSDRVQNKTMYISCANVYANIWINKTFGGSESGENPYKIQAPHTEFVVQVFIAYILDCI